MVYDWVLMLLITSRLKLFYSMEAALLARWKNKKNIGFGQNLIPAAGTDPLHTAYYLIGNFYLYEIICSCAR